MANIGTLAISVVAKTNKFESGMKRSKAAWLGFVKGFVSVAAITGAIRTISREIAEASERIDQLAKSGRALGITYQEMRRLSIIAQMSGIEVNSLSTGMRALSVQVLNAQRGLKTSVDLFDRLGMKVQDLHGLALPDLMERVAKSISTIEDPAERMALAAQLLGRQGAAIVAAADGLDAATAASKRVSDSLTNDQVAAVEAANDSWTELTESMNSFFNSAAANSATMRKEIFDAGSSAVRMIRDATQSDEGRTTRDFIGDTLLESALPVVRVRNLFRNLDKATRKEAARLTGFDDVLTKALGGDTGFSSIVSESTTWGEDSGSAYATAFEDALSKKFQQADAFENALKDATRSALHASMDAVEERLNGLSGEANRLRESARPRMSAGVQAKTSGFDIRGLMIGGGLNNQEQKQLDELEDQSKYLQLIYRRLGNQVAMVGA